MPRADAGLPESTRRAQVSSARADPRAGPARPGRPLGPPGPARPPGPRGPARPPGRS